MPPKARKKHTFSGKKRARRDPSKKPNGHNKNSPFRAGKRKKGGNTASLKWPSLTRERLDQLNRENNSPSDQKPKIESMSEAGWDETNSETGDGELLTVKDRHPANHAEAKLEDAEYDSRVAVFSREASKHFSKKFWEMVTSDGGYGTRQSRNRFTSEKRKQLEGRQKICQVNSQFGQQVDNLIENKRTPHAIIVIEGPQESKAVNVMRPRPTTGSKRKREQESEKAEASAEPVIIGYSRVMFDEGKTKADALDAKQNFAVYVRDDMVGAYTAETVEIERGANNFRVVALDYETKDGAKYRSLFVHIPNEYATSREYRTTHEAIEEYAKNLKDRTVTGYSGDTNFKSAFYHNSIPSAGGHGAGGITLNPRSSGAGADTNFMQSIPVGNKSGKKHQVKQPSMLNLLDIKTTEERKTATDHTSIMTTTAHTSPIKGRNAEGNLAYYREAKELKQKKKRWEKMQNSKMDEQAFAE